MKCFQIYSALLSFSLVFTQVSAVNKTTTFSNVTKNKSEKTDHFQNRLLVQKFHDIRHISSSVIMRLIELAEEEVRIENELRMEQERRDKIYREYLASRVQSSFMRDFLTLRY
jgi:hypothetical protein